MKLSSADAGGGLGPAEAMGAEAAAVQAARAAHGAARGGHARQDAPVCRCHRGARARFGGGLAGRAQQRRRAALGRSPSGGRGEDICHLRNQAVGWNGHQAVEWVRVMPA